SSDLGSLLLPGGLAHISQRGGRMGNRLSAAAQGARSPARPTGHSRARPPARPSARAPGHLPTSRRPAPRRSGLAVGLVEVVVAEDGLGEGAGVVLEQAPAAV